MTLPWVIRAVAAGVLLAAAAVYAERAAGWLRLPRRGCWTAAMAATLLLPLMALAAPDLLPRMDPLPPTDAPALAAPAEVTGEPAAAAATVPFGLFGAGWLAASLAMLAALGMDAALRGLPGARLHGAKVRVSDDTGPATVGVLMPEIVVPRWVLRAPEDEARLIVRHEREHVAAGDTRLLALAALAVAAMPWNPALWWQLHRLRLAVETDCDARGLATRPCVRSYALALLRTASTPFASPPLALSWGGRATHLERRIDAMTAIRPTHRLPRTLAAATAAGCLMAAACDMTETGAASADARHAAVPRVVDEGIDRDGRSFRHTDNADGTMTVEVGPDPRAPRGELGLSWGADYPGGYRPGDPRTVYPHVRRVQPGSPAADAGLATHDTILSSNDRDARLGNPFPDRTPGTVYTLRLRRNGVERETRLTVGAEAPVALSPAPPSSAGGTR